MIAKLPKIHSHMDLERNFFVIYILSFVFPFFKSYFGNGRNGDNMNLITSKEISKDTFFIVYDSIVKEYNLTPVDILVYSIIRSYCDSNDNKGYYGSIQSLAERINSSVPTVQRSLNRLVSGDKPLLERKQNKFNCSVYTTIKMIDDGYQNDRHKTIKMIDNNKIDNKINDIKENIKENLTEDGLDFSDIVIPKKNYCFRNGKKVYYSNKYDDADLDFLLE